jgi:hypothetical protein
VYSRKLEVHRVRSLNIPLDPTLERALARAAQAECRTPAMEALFVLRRCLLDNAKGDERERRKEGDHEV